MLEAFLATLMEPFLSDGTKQGRGNPFSDPTPILTPKEENLGYILKKRWV
jgi:hypothetical protein